MSEVGGRTVDLMIMEMRKLDRDRDRVLIPDTVMSLLEKYHIYISQECLQYLLDKYEDRDMFKGMINYEDLVR